MQNNEFEKQVQVRMGQIKFTPSEAVWAEVEKNLKQRRKRRIAIFWLFIFFIAAGGSTLGWFYLSPSGNHIANHTSTPNSTIKNTTEIPPVHHDNDQSSASLSDKKENPETKNNLKSASSASTDDVKTNPVSANKAALSQKNNIPGQSTLIQKNKNISGNQVATLKRPGSRNNKTRDKNSAAAVLTSGSVVENKVQGDKTNKIDSQSDQAIAKKENTAITDSSAVQKDSAANLVKSIKVGSLAASASTVKIKTNAKPKWQFSFSAAIGMSDIVYPPSMGKSLDSARTMASPPSSNLSAPGNSFQSTAIYISPKELNPGIEFSLGFSAGKKIKKRTSFTVGLQYHYYSTSISVGPYLDSASSFNNNRTYLAAGSRVNDQTNQYHFIEIPATFEFQLLKNKPLQLSSGISLGQLISSNVLTYYSSQGVFIADGSNINKTQLNILLGISWMFGEKSRMPIQVGPNFSYGASNLSDKSKTGSNHMYTIGAGAKIMFNKK